MDMTLVAPGINQVNLQLPGAEWLTTFYLIPEGGAIFEPGPAAAIPAILQTMKELGMARLDHIIPTHIHIDHAGAIGGLARLFPSARVILHPVAVKHAIDPTRLISSYRRAFGEGFESVYGEFSAVPAPQVQAAVDGEILDIGGRRFQAHFSPGHADHHVAYFEPATGVFFCGEAMGIPFPGSEQSPLPAAAPPSFDPEVYLKTAARLSRLNPGMLLYSHFRPGPNPAELIPRMMENTRILTDIIREGLLRGDSRETISGDMWEYFHRHRGVTLGRVDRLLLDGYIHYFSRQGITAGGKQA